MCKSSPSLTVTYHPPLTSPSPPSPLSSPSPSPPHPSPPPPLHLSSPPPPLSSPSRPPPLSSLPPVHTGSSEVVQLWSLLHDRWWTRCHVPHRVREHCPLLPSLTTLHCLSLCPHSTYYHSPPPSPHPHSLTHTLTPLPPPSLPHSHPYRSPSHPP